VWAAVEVAVWYAVSGPVWAAVEVAV